MKNKDFYEKYLNVIHTFRDSPEFCEIQKELQDWVSQIKVCSVQVEDTMRPFCLISHPGKLHRVAYRPSSPLIIPGSQYVGSFPVEEKVRYSLCRLYSATYRESPDPSVFNMQMNFLLGNAILAELKKIESDVESKFMEMVGSQEYKDKIRNAKIINMGLVIFNYLSGAFKNENQEDLKEAMDMAYQKFLESGVRDVQESLHVVSVFQRIDHSGILLRVRVSGRSLASSIRGSRESS